MVRTETLDVGGVRTHLKRAGRGEPVLLLHGHGASSYTWRFVLPALAERYEVFAPDVVGFGRSDKPMDFDYSLHGLHGWTMRLMDRLGLERARFVGNSMGGVIALWTAMEAPARLERMALLGVPAYVEDRPRLIWPLSWPVVGPVFEAMLGERLVRILGRGMLYDQSKLDDEFVAEYSLALKTAAGRRAAAEFVRRAVPPDHAERVRRYRGLAHPALVMVGANDRVVSVRSAARLAGELPNARLAVLERCGHVPQEDAPERAIPALLDFLGAA